MAKKTPASLRADAAHLRKLAANALVQAEQFEREAVRLEDDEEAKAETAKWFFAMVRNMRRAH